MTERQKKMAERLQNMIADRDSGMTYREIGEKYGISKQRVASIMPLAEKSTKHFRPITKVGCIYPNLRKWMNENRISKRELLRRMGLTTAAENSQNLSDHMAGRTDPRKKYIDQLLSATEMTYEELFYREER